MDQHARRRKLRGNTPDNTPKRTLSAEQLAKMAAGREAKKAKKTEVKKPAAKKTATKKPVAEKKFPVKQPTPPAPVAEPTPPAEPAKD